MALSTTSKKLNPFRKLLFSLKSQLQTKEVTDMASLVVGEEGQPGERVIEEAGGDGLKFFLLLQKHGSISETDCDLLIELLTTIGRMDLTKLVDKYMKECTPNTNQSTSTEVTSSILAVSALQGNQQDPSSLPQTPFSTNATSPRSPPSTAQSGASSRPSPDGSFNSSQSSATPPSPMSATSTKEQGISQPILHDTPKTSMVPNPRVLNNEPSKESAPIQNQFPQNRSQAEISSSSNLPSGSQDQSQNSEQASAAPDTETAAQQQLKPRVEDAANTPTAANIQNNTYQPLPFPPQNSTRDVDIQDHLHQSQGQVPVRLQPSPNRNSAPSDNKVSGNKWYGSLSSHPEQFDKFNTSGKRLQSILDESLPASSDLGGTIETASASSSASASSLDSNVQQNTSRLNAVPKGTQHNIPSETNQSSRSDTQSTDNLQKQMEDLSLDCPENPGVASNDIETDAPEDTGSINGKEQKPGLNDDSKTSGPNQLMTGVSSEVSQPTSNDSQNQVVQDHPEANQDVALNLTQDDENGASVAPPPAPSNEPSAMGNASSNNKNEQPVKELRAYQVELATPPKSGRNYIICAPTGSGKTLTAAAICYHFYEQALANQSYFKALFIVNIRHLTQQQRRAFRDRFPSGTVGTVGETDQLKDIFFAEGKYVVMVTAQIVVNALNSRDISLQDLSMIVFDECHHTTQNHPYNEIMKRYLKEKKIKMGLRRVVGESGDRLPHIIGLSASLGVGHGKSAKAAYVHVKTLCGNMDAKNVLQVLENKEELGEHVNAPENDAIRYVSPRRAEQRDLSDIIEGIMGQIEGELWSSESVLVERGTQQYEQWVREEQNEAESNSDRAKTLASMYLFEYNSALLLLEDLRALDSLKHLEEFMHQRDLEQELVPIEELCRKLFEAEHVEMKRICREEAKSPNPKLVELANLLREKFESKPDSKGIILTRRRLATSALIEFIQRAPSLQGLPCPVKPVQLVGQGDSDRYFMTETEQKLALKKFKTEKDCNLLVATDIAQEGLDMPACNFVIRFNFVSNEIGTVQSKGRARAKQSQCYLIVEEDSINAKRELSNRKKVIDMQAAMDELNALSEEKRLQEITATQEEIYKKLEKDEKTNQAAKCLSTPSGSVEMLCKECNTYITRGSFMKTKGCHYNCHDPKVKDRITLVLYDKPTRYRDTETIGVFKCGNPSCGQRLGIAVHFLKEGAFTLDGYGFSVKAFLFKFSEDRKKTYKQWKKVPIDIPEDDL